MARVRLTPDPHLSSQPTAGPIFGVQLLNDGSFVVKMWVICVAAL